LAATTRDSKDASSLAESVFAGGNWRGANGTRMCPTEPKDEQATVVKAANPRMPVAHALRTRPTRQDACYFKTAMTSRPRGGDQTADVQPAPYSLNLGLRSVPLTATATVCLLDTQCVLAANVVSADSGSRNSTLVGFETRSALLGDVTRAVVAPATITTTPMRYAQMKRLNLVWAVKVAESSWMRGVTSATAFRSASQVSRSSPAEWLRSREALPSAATNAPESRKYGWPIAWMLNALDSHVSLSRRSFHGVGPARSTYAQSAVATTPAMTVAATATAGTQWSPIQASTPVSRMSSIVGTNATARPISVAVGMNARSHFAVSLYTATPGRIHPLRLPTFVGILVIVTAPSKKPREEHSVMPDVSDYLVLPISALKAQASRVFDALAHGRTVYVSKHGEITAAFRPFEVVPEGIAAAYASPSGFAASEVTARQLGRAVPSAAIADAVGGLPSLVTKAGNVFGVLTAATNPAPAVVPDVERAGARAEAVREYLEDHPDAPLDTIMAITEEWEPNGQPADRRPAVVSAADEIAARVESPDVSGAVEEDLRHWRERGSQVEALVETILRSVGRVASTLAPLSVPAVDALPDVLISILDAAGRDEVTALRWGERREADNDVIDARAGYVAALIVGATPSRGAMWRLGELARREGYRVEASTWYRFALTYDHAVALKPNERSRSGLAQVAMESSAVLTGRGDSRR
jgi:hypothetical protein